MREVPRRLGVNPYSLYKCLKPFGEPTRKPVVDHEAENQRPKRELARLPASAHPAEVRGLGSEPEEALPALPRGRVNLAQTGRIQTRDRHQGAADDPPPEPRRAHPSGVSPTVERGPNPEQD